MNRKSLRRPCLRLLSLLLACPALGRGGPAAMNATEYCRHSSSGCNYHPSSCIRAHSLLNSSLSSAVTISFTNISLFMRPVFYLILTSFHFSTYSYVDCTRYTPTPISFSPPLDASAWAEFPIDLAGDIVTYSDILPGAVTRSPLLGHRGLSLGEFRVVS